MLIRWALRNDGDFSRERGNSVTQEITLNFGRPSTSGDRMNQALVAAVK